MASPRPLVESEDQCGRFQNANRANINNIYLEEPVTRITGFELIELSIERAY
jgi:hypothetical protein